MEKPFFVIDEMLSGLIRWLRFLGFHAIPAKSADDLTRNQEIKNPIVFLTSSKKNLGKSGYDKELFIQSSIIEDQLRELNSVYFIFESVDLLSICSICNKKVEKVNKNDVQKVVPAKIWESNEAFWTCPECHRIYWKGGHIPRLKDKLKRMGIPVS